ncbi:MAG: OsmC family protein [Rhodobacteraceae bacterium]|nr:OsmC family protein [Paracoccaceae bacterium]
MAACQLVTIVKLAEAMGFQYSDLNVEAETDVAFRAAQGDMSPVPRFTAARMIVNIQSDETKDRYQQLIDLVEERCPVSKLFLDASLPVEVDWR